MEEHQELLAARVMNDVRRAIGSLHLTTQWAQSKASEDQLEEVTDLLFLAMHERHSALVCKKADCIVGNG
jgi:hypothetical protein